MGNALFYHLTQSTAEQLVAVLITKALAADWRVELRGTEPERMARLDEDLWRGEGFLPHGLAGGPHDARQPVLLTCAPPHGYRADCLFTLDGAAISPEECAGLERICIIFDGHDSAALDHARGQWRALTKAGIAAEYWSEADGRWQKKA